MSIRLKGWADPYQQVPGIVFGCLRAGELRLTVLPGVGLAYGGAPYDVPVQLVPAELRMPNTTVWVQFDQAMKIVRVWSREQEHAAQ